MMTAILVWITFLKPGWGMTPGRGMDDVFYDNIAYNLAAGVGYQLDFQDEVWLEPYVQDNEDGKNDWIKQTTVKGPTTTRAPGYPFLVSLIYRTIGHNWDAVRVLNAIILALGLACLITAVWSHFGTLAASLLVFTLVFDFGVMAPVGELTTEAVATGMLAFDFALLIWIWMKN